MKKAALGLAGLSVTLGAMSTDAMAAQPHMLASSRSYEIIHNIVPEMTSETSAQVHVSPDGTTTTRQAGSTITVAAGDSTVTIDGTGNHDLVIRPLVPKGSTARVVKGVSVFSGASYSVAEQPVDEASGGGVRTLITLNDASAPKAFPVALTLEAGARLVKRSDGGVAIVNADGTSTFGLAAPWAKDANGHPVPTYYDISGTAVTQRIITTATTAYPVVADPWYRRWYGWTYVLSRDQTKDVAAGAGAAVGNSLGGGVGAVLGGVAGAGLGRYAVSHGQCIAVNFAYWGIFLGLSGC